MLVEYGIIDKFRSFNLLEFTTSKSLLDQFEMSIFDIFVKSKMIKTLINQLESS